MLRKIDSQERPVLYIVPVDPTQTATQADESNAEESAAEIRRRMYERIARGNALAEAEASAHNQWRGS